MGVPTHVTELNTKLAEVAASSARAHDTEGRKAAADKAAVAEARESLEAVAVAMGAGE